MERRHFLRSGAALMGAAGVGASLPADAFALAARGAPSAAGPVRLSANENPLGVSPSAWQAVVDARMLANRYPFQQASAFIDLLAGRLGVRPENIVLGNGSTEILQMAVQAAATPNAPLVMADPTFEDVTDYQQTETYRLVKVPLAADYAHDLTRMREVAEAERRPCVVYLCNPNNPTGTITPSRDVDAWIADAPETTLFLVDEAYYEYADDPAYWTAQKWIEGPNVVVVRTFSKIFGMAGMRLGYAMAHADTATRLRAFMGQNNADQFALAAATASLQDGELMGRSIAVNEESKAIVHRTLDELGLEYLPTRTNFIMHRISGQVEPYIERMASHGITVGRPFPPMLTWNRVSFGLPEEMELWAAAVRDLRMAGQV